MIMIMKAVHVDLSYVLISQWSRRRKEKKRLLYLHTKLPPGLVFYRLFYRVGIACRRMVYRSSGNFRVRKFSWKKFSC